MDRFFNEDEPRSSNKVLRKIATALLDLKIFTTEEEALDWLCFLGLSQEECIKRLEREEDDDFTKKRHRSQQLNQRKWWKRYPKKESSQPYFNRNDNIREIITKEISPASYGDPLKILICHGAHGVGKTALIKNLCQQELRPFYQDGIFWLDKHITSIDAAYQELNEQLLETGGAHNFWTRWLKNPGHRVLIVLDDVKEEIAKAILPLGGEKTQFLLIGTSLLKLQRVALGIFSRYDISAINIPHLIDETFQHWHYEIPVYAGAAPSAIKYMQEHIEEIADWCEKISYLPEGMLAILNAYIEKGYGYEGVQVDEQTIGIKSLTRQLLSDLPSIELKESILFLEESVGAKVFDIHEAAYHFSISPEEAKTKMDNWVTLGFLEHPKYYHLNEYEFVTVKRDEYRVLRIIHEACELARRNHITPIEFLRPDLAENPQSARAHL